MLSQSTAEITTIAKSRRPADERLRQLIVATMQLFDQHYPHLFVYVSADLERLPVSQELKAWFLQHTRELTELWEAVVAEGVREGTFQTELPIEVATATIFGALAWTHRWYRPENDLAAEAIGEGMADLLIDGLRSRDLRARGS
ncbi:MAG: TetR/AcrR family transcriptional regulator C-terminal domain-containing protein [Mycobacteriales bacterium]